MNERQAIKNRYFEQYKLKMLNNIPATYADAKRWEDAKLLMPGLTLEEKAEYADEVTRKSAADFSDTQLADEIEELVIDMTMLPFDLHNACAIGNAAYLVLEGKRRIPNNTKALGKTRRILG